MKNFLFISAVAATVLFSGCGGGGGSSDDSTQTTTPAAGNQATTGTQTPTTGTQTPATGSEASGTEGAGGTGGTGAQISDPANGNAIKDGGSDGFTNRPADQTVAVGTKEWLVIQTTEIQDINGTNYNEAFFPKRTWAEADYFCKNLVQAPGTWALPTRMELLSIMTPTVTDIKSYNEASAVQFIVDPKVLPDDGTVGAFSSAIFYDQPNKAVYMGRAGVPGSPNIELTTLEDDGTPEEYLFTCVKQ